MDSIACLAMILSSLCVCTYRSARVKLTYGLRFIRPKWVKRSGKIVTYSIAELKLIRNRNLLSDRYKFSVKSSIK